MEQKVMIERFCYKIKIFFEKIGRTITQKLRNCNENLSQMLRRTEKLCYICFSANDTTKGCGRFEFYLFLQISFMIYNNFINQVYGSVQKEKEKLL